MTSSQNHESPTRLSRWYFTTVLQAKLRTPSLASRSFHPRPSRRQPSQGSSSTLRPRISTFFFSIGCGAKAWADSLWRKSGNVCWHLCWKTAAENFKYRLRIVPDVRSTRDERLPRKRRGLNTSFPRTGDVVSGRYWYARRDGVHVNVKYEKKREGAAAAYCSIISSFVVDSVYKTNLQSPINWGLLIGKNNAVTRQCGEAHPFLFAVRRSVTFRSISTDCIWCSQCSVKCFTCKGEKITLK